jgi:hypothetical protein
VGLAHQSSQIRLFAHPPSSFLPSGCREDSNYLCWMLDLYEGTSLLWNPISYRGGTVGRQVSTPRKEDSCMRQTESCRGQSVLRYL